MSLRVEVEETFAAPPERVYAALVDVDRMTDWMKGCVRVERLEGPPSGKGARFRQTRKMFGKEASEVFEVTAADPPRTLELHVDGRQGSSGCGDYRFRYDLRPAGGGTAMRVTGEIGGMGWFMRMIGKLFAGSFRKAFAKDLAALKAHVEKTAATS